MSKVKHGPLWCLRVVNTLDRNNVLKIVSRVKHGPPVEEYFERTEPIQQDNKIMATESSLRIWTGFNNVMKIMSKDKHGLQFARNALREQNRHIRSARQHMWPYMKFTNCHELGSHNNLKIMSKVKHGPSVNDKCLLRIEKPHMFYRQLNHSHR